MTTLKTLHPFLRLLNRNSYCVARSLYNVSVTSNACRGYITTSKQLTGLLSIPNTSDIYVARMISCGKVKSVTYHEVKTLIQNKNVVLIDVREPNELLETGDLPGAINVPLAEVENALKNSSADEFYKRYGLAKPHLNSAVIFSCRSGTRSAKAAQTAISLGYKDVTNYAGGWLDWEKHTKDA